MKQFIKENWGFLCVGILNLIVAFATPFKWVAILNSCVGSSIITAFVVFCILYYYEDKLNKDVTVHK